MYTTLAPKGTLRNAAFQRRVHEGHARPETNDQNQSASIASPQDPAANAAQPANGNFAAMKPPGSVDVVRSASSPVLQSSTSRVTPASVRTAAIATDGNIDNSVMNETLTVINEHITDMHTPPHSMLRESRRGANDSGSEYSNQVGQRLSYIIGQETDDEESGLHSEAEVSKWTPDQVAEYLEDVGVERKHCDVFREQEISGEVLLGMDQPSIFIKEFDLGPVGRRLRTWQKIKALQEEVRGASKRSRSVSEYSGGEATSQDSVNRNRGTSAGAVLPRISSISERPVSRNPSIHTESSTSLAVSSPFGPGVSPLPSVQTSSIQEPSPRPSAASVRQMNHSRRYSSIDNTNTPIATIIPEASLSASPTRTMHKKIPSLDKNWGGLASPPSAQSGRPASSAHGHSLSTDGTPFDGHGSNFTVITPNELERGYFSGGEVEMRSAKVTRNVLRKNQSASHSRDSSYDARRRSEAPRAHLRAGSAESIQAYGGSPASPAAQHYYGKVSRPSRAASGPDFSAASFASTKDLPPTVTKLEFSQSPSMDAIANSPALGSGGGSESSSVVAPSPAQQQHPFWSKPRITGIRTISDAVTGDEKAKADADKPPISPVKEWPTSPTRTGSTTPSRTSVEASELPNNRQSTVASIASATTGSRHRSKKTTSAYTRGLVKKTPQEQIAKCDYSGWMKKKSSNLMTTWKTRLFVLKGRRLSYYYSENDTEEKGLIDISSHRVLPADTERLTGLHATLTGATASPTSPQNAQTPTSASIDAEKSASAATSPTATNSVAPSSKDSSGIFIFKLVPPRSGLSKAVNFTKPTVHYFAVDNIQQGRLWMAALMKATIDRDESKSVITTYQQKTMSLAKARATKQRPPALMESDDRSPVSPIEETPTDGGLNIHGLPVAENVGQDRERSDRDKDKDSGVGGMEKQKNSLDSSGRGSGRGSGTPHLPTPTSAGAISDGAFTGEKDAVAGAELGAE